MIVSFVTAYMLHSKLLSRVQGIYKPLLFIPQIIPTIATSLIWRIILSKDYGVINQLLGTSIDFLNDSLLRKLAVVVLLTWRDCGWYMVVFLAGLTTINDEISDASRIDGTNAFQHITKITLPIMRPIFLFAFIINSIGSLRLYTEPNILLPTGSQAILSNPDAMPVMNILAIKLVGADFGGAAATGWLVFILVAAMSALWFKVFRDKDA
jgi:ABC-type sugar transport system permease subunit